MKTFITIGLLLVSVPMLSQQLIMASNESDRTSGLYKKASESLSSGDTRQALNMFDQVVEVFHEEGRADELPENYLGMGLSLALTGYYAESIRYHKKALRAHRKYKSKAPADEILINLGLVYQLAGKERKSQKLFSKHKLS